MTTLVGYTGFVGSNIYASGNIDQAYNSSNIIGAYGTAPDVLIYAGMRAEKYLANTNPKADMELVLQAEYNITKIAPKKLVLISTIDVLKEPSDKNEDSEVDCDGLQTYGLNRYILEQWVRANYPDALIIRLPGLYGINIKKNFIYDYIHLIPFMLNEKKYFEILSLDKEIMPYYELQSNGFYKCRLLTLEEQELLKNKFKAIGFTALNFTDSRNIYQFYPLSRLWNDIQIAIRENLLLWHAATEPLSAAEIYYYLTDKQFINEITPSPVYYNYKTKYAKLFGGKDGYLMTKAQILKDIQVFVGGK